MPWRVRSSRLVSAAAVHSGRWPPPRLAQISFESIESLDPIGQVDVELQVGGDPKTDFKVGAAPICAGGTGAAPACCLACVVLPLTGRLRGGTAFW